MTRTFLRFYVALVVVISVLVVTSAIYLYQHQDYLDQETVEDAFGLGPLLAARVLKTSATPEVDIESMRRELGYDVQLEASGTLPEQALARLRAGRATAYFYRNEKHLLAASLDNERVIVLDLGPYDEPGATEWMIVIFGSLQVLALLLLFMLGPIAKQRKALRRAAEQITAGNWSARVEERGGGDERAVAQAFNAMSQRVGQQIEHQHQLFRAISHELRTPLARMRFRAEILADRDITSDVNEHATAIDRDLHQIDALLSELLTHARLESGTEISTERFEIHEELATTIAERCSGSPRVDASLGGSDTESPITVELRGGEQASLMIVANRRLFSRAIGNLLSNALRYAEHAVWVEVHTPVQGEVEVRVCDDGAGIPSDDRERLVRPFERGVPSSAAAGTTTGLGLTIVRSVAIAHKQAIEIVESAQGGCEVRTHWQRD